MDIGDAERNALELASRIQELKEEDPVQAVHLCTGSIVGGAEMLVTLLGPYTVASLLIGVATRLIKQASNTLTQVHTTH